MRKVPRVPRFLVAAVFTAGAAAAGAAAPLSSLHRSGPARVTIRGTGNAIAVERTGEPAPLLPAGEPSYPVLGEAIGMKESGSTDEVLVGYLRAHRSELPSLVDLDTVAALRRAGAGRDVVAFLASVAAVEIGPTGAEGKSPEEPAYAAPEGGAPWEGEMSNELPAWLGWGGGAVLGPAPGGFHRHGFHPGRGTLPRGMHGNPRTAGPRSFGRMPRR